MYVSYLIIILVVNFSYFCVSERILKIGAHFTEL